eukprot:1542801-Pleurochrysis_carterae.AAC.1
MRRHDATARALGRRSAFAGIARAAALLNDSGGDAPAPRLMQSAKNRATRWMRREGGANGCVIIAEAQDCVVLLSERKESQPWRKGGEVVDASVMTPPLAA